MKKLDSKKDFVKIRLFLFTFSLIGILTSCGILNDFVDAFTNFGNTTNQILDQAINDLNGNAENYGHIMEEAIDKIENENVKEQLQEALDNAIITASSEVRCDIQFTVDYLIKKIKIIKASYNHETLPVENPQICNNNPSIIDMNLAANQRNKIEITGYFLNEDFRKYHLTLYSTTNSSSNQTTNLSMSSDFKLIVNLGSNGVILDESSSRLELTWDDNIVTSIPIIQRHPEPCQIRERTFTGLPKLVLYPAHKKSPWAKKGDKEFDGHGPCTKGNVTIFTRNNGKELWAKGYVQMWECPDDFSKIKEDYTYGDITKEIKLVDVDNGWRIKNIKESTYDQFQNIDRRDDATEEIGGSGPVSMYLIQGDTDGDDLGSSRVEITFKNIKVTLQEIGDCISD